MKKFFIFVALLIATLTTTNLTFGFNATAAPAAQTTTAPEEEGEEGSSPVHDPTSTAPTVNRGSCRTFLGMYSWDCGVDLDNIKSTNALKDSILVIASNVLLDLSIIAAYLVLGYVIYGGYLYIFANGDAGKVAGGKKTLTRAFIGLAVVACTNIILNTIRLAFMGSSGAFPQNCTTSECVSADNLVSNALGWFIAIAGVVAAIFLVVGGIGYITSAGDSGKLQKAKNTITYSLIGLVIVGLSQVATGFVTNIVNSANNGSTLESAIQSILNSVIAVAGVVSVVFIVIGGYTYMTSAGDAGKLKKAKDTLLYACIGLAVCALAFVIVNWAIGIVNTETPNVP